MRQELERIIEMVQLDLGIKDVNYKIIYDPVVLFQSSGVANNVLASVSPEQDLFGNEYYQINIFEKNMKRMYKNEKKYIRKFVDIIAHELRHVYQMENGILDMDDYIQPECLVSLFQYYFQDVEKDARRYGKQFSNQPYVKNYIESLY